jgi:microsomal dipeptidase-like Zn-dependent dipeptidase
VFARKTDIAVVAALVAAGVSGVALAADRPGGGVDGSAPHAAIRSESDLANGCLALASVKADRFVAISGADGYRADRRRKGRAAAFYLKPTGLGTYMLRDQQRELAAVEPGGGVVRVGEPGALAEWAIRRNANRTFAISSTAARRGLAVDPKTGDLVLVAAGAGGRASQFRFSRDRGCRPFPEAKVGASGRTFRGTKRDGTVFGFSDIHLHVTADLRAGGRVIYGESFDPFGITEALGHDDRDHGPDGSLDVTGNLLRGGNPAGTHDTHGWPTFAGWPVHDTYTHQQTYYVWLERMWKAGLRLIVAQTVEDQPLCEIEPQKAHSCDETESAELQIRRLRSMQDYIDAQSGGRGRGWFRLVYSPRQARRVIERGRLAVVIGLESSSPLGCSESHGVPQCTRADIDRGLDELHSRGIRSLFIAHWVDNAFAGAALQSGATGDFIALMQVQQTGEPFATEPCVGAADEADGECNSKGLTALGRYLVRRMMAKQMLIEVDHLSQKARESVLEMAEAKHYPLVSSHTGTGGAWTPAQLRRLYGLGGIASARPDTAPQLAATILDLRQYGSPKYYFGVGLGTDTGGFNAAPGPRPGAAKHPLHYPFRSYDGKITFVCQLTGTRKYDLNKDGVAHYGLYADLIADVQQQRRGKAALRPFFRSAEAYLQMWARTYRHL